MKPRQAPTALGNWWTAGSTPRARTCARHRRDATTPAIDGAQGIVAPMSAPAASCRDTVRRWRHEFRPDRIGDRFAQDPINLGLGRPIERPAGDLVDRPQLIGTTRAPQRRGDALIEHPA